MPRNTENFCHQHDVFVGHYHCDDGYFETKHSLMMLQSNCAAYAQFQNGKAEKATGDVQDVARTMFLHSKARWHYVVHLSLWPYTMRMAVHIMNHLSDEVDGSSRVEKFS